MDIEEKRYWRKTITYICLLTAAILAGAIFLIPFHWPVGFIVWLLILFGGGLFSLVRWHANNTAYICPKCGHTFMISTAKDFLSPHMGDKKLLRCPKCGESSWCKVISVKSVKGEISFKKEEKIKTKSTKSLYIQIGIVLFVYLLLWANTLYIYPKLPETIPTHFDITGKPDAWGHKSSFLILPFFAMIFPMLHGIFCLYATKQGYKSFVYPLLTVVFIIILLIFRGLQYLTLSRAM